MKKKICRAARLTAGFLPQARGRLGSGCPGRLSSARTFDRSFVFDHFFFSAPQVRGLLGLLESVGNDEVAAAVRHLTTGV